MSTNAAGWTSEEFLLIAERAYEIHLQGKHTEALTIIRGLLAIDPGNIYCLDAAAALSLALKRPDNALQYTSLLLSVSPAHDNAMARQCEANIVLGRYREAHDVLHLLKHTGSTALYKRMKMRLAAALRAPISAANAESTDRLNAITK